MAALYARVSTADKGQDPERQLHELRNFAEARQWATVEVVDEMSASKDRPGLRELWKLCRQRRVDIVLVHEFSRFARSTKELVLALEEFNSLGIEFVSLKESVDTTTPVGKLLYVLIAAMAEFERELISERVRSGIALRRDWLERDGSFVSKTTGKLCYRFGRPKLPVDAVYIEKRRQEGVPWALIAAELKVSADTCKRSLRRKLAL